MKHKNIAIIGAGFAGAVLADRLLQAGKRVTLFEKSRGSGGRLSSCRIGQDSADLGAPWFEPESNEFSQWLKQRQEVQVWRAKHYRFSGSATEPKTVFLSTPRQKSLTQNLIRGANLCTESRITEIAQHSHQASQGLYLTSELAPIKTCYDAVIVTTPAPQAAPMLTLAPRLQEVAASARTTLNWVAVIALKEKINVDADVFSGPHSTLYRAIKDTRKPGRNPSNNHDIWTLEANIEWSQQHIDSHKTTVGRALTKAFGKVIRQPLTVGHTRVHRWLYARHQSVIQDSFLWDDSSNIGVCADWLCHKNTEGAWLSANALADHLLS